MNPLPFCQHRLSIPNRIIISRLFLVYEIVCVFFSPRLCAKTKQGNHVDKRLNVAVISGVVIQFNLPTKLST